MSYNIAALRHFHICTSLLNSVAYNIAALRHCHICIHTHDGKPFKSKTLQKPLLFGQTVSNVATLRHTNICALIHTFKRSFFLFFNSFYFYFFFLIFFLIVFISELILITFMPASVSSHTFTSTKCTSVQNKAS